MKVYRWVIWVLLTVAGMMGGKGCRRPDDRASGKLKFAVIFDQFQCFTNGEDAIEFELWIDESKEDLDQNGGNVLEKRRGNTTNQVFSFVLPEGVYWYRVQFNCLCKVDTVCTNHGYVDYDNVLGYYYKLYIDTVRVYPNQTNEVIKRF